MLARTLYPHIPIDCLFARIRENNKVTAAAFTLRYGPSYHQRERCRSHHICAFAHAIPKSKKLT
jgi:hypothetical protein